MAVTVAKAPGDGVGRKDELEIILEDEAQIVVAAEATGAVGL